MISNRENGTYLWAANAVRDHGSPILPAWYGEEFNAAPTDPFLFDFVPQVDRGPFIVTSIQGLPYNTATAAVQSTVLIKSGARDICFAPINTISLQNPAGAQMPLGSNLPQPIVVWPGSSLYLRNNSGGVAGTSGPIIHGFHTDERGGRTIARLGELWAFPIHFDFTVSPTRSLDQVMDPGTTEIIGLTEDVNTAGATITSLQVSVRGVDLVFGNTRFGAVGAPSGWQSAGHPMLARVRGGDTVRFRAVQPAGANMLSMTCFTRRTYREGSLC